MKKSRKQEPDTGQNEKSNEKQSLPASKQKKIRSKKSKESQTNPSPSPNGSTLETPKERTKELSESAADNGVSTIRKKKPKHPMPVPKIQALESRTLKALRRIKVKPEALQGVPQITSMLKTSVKGGLTTALDAMRFASSDPEIAAFLKTYDKIPIGDRQRLPWEAITIASKVNPVYLLGAIQLAVHTYCLNKSRFMAISNHPDIMQKRIKWAKMGGGEKDRTVLDIMVGALPSPKGPTFVGKQVAVYNAPGSQAKDDEGKLLATTSDSSDGFDDLFPDPNKVQEALVPIRQRLLEG